MKILIISPGKNYDTSIKDGLEEYQKRLDKRFQVEWNFPTADSKEAEARVILKLIKKDDFVILLDERGKDIDNQKFVEFLNGHIQSGTKKIVFVIGGAFGVSGEVKERANSTIKLSSLVFPHMIVRLILIEQLYRSQTILDGGKYHHG